MSQAALGSESSSSADLESADLAASPLVAQIRALVHRNTRRWKLLTVLEGLGLTVSALLAYLLVIFWLDNAWHFPQVGRVIASLGLFAGLAFLAVSLVRRWRALRFTEDQVALAIERRTRGGVQNRLINALQLARSTGGNSVELSRAVIEENVTQMRQLELEQAAALRPALVRVAVAAALVVVGATFYYLQPERFTNAAQRLFLPLADVAPLYRTTVRVEPGDVEAAGDIDLTITIQGERPRELSLLEEVEGKRTTTPIRVTTSSGPVRHTLRGVTESRRYAVRGGDYTTRFYQITVPTPSHLSLLTTVYHYPPYTGLGDKRMESASGNVEGLRGTTVDLTFTLDPPCAAAALVVERQPAKEGEAAPPVERIALTAAGPAQFKGTLTLADQAAYRIETTQTGRSPFLGKPYAVRVLPDLEPKLELTGFDGKGEAAVDAVLPYRAAATDDWGLAEVGLFFRRAVPAAAGSKDGQWQEIAKWSGEGKQKLEQSGELTLLALAVAEGERLELVLRAKDRDPAKTERWTDGTIFTLEVGGDAAALQLLYEQILRTEAELKQLLADERKILIPSVDWLRKLDGEGGLKWDDPKNVAALHAAIADLGKQQVALRTKAGATARAMVAEAGSLQMSVALLADTEMVRGERIFESVPNRDQTQAKRSALADAQLTTQRTIASLQQMLDSYSSFRQDWELNHLTGFVKMLAEREASLHETSLVNVKRPRDKLSDAWQASAARRQEKLTELAGLAETGLIGLGDKLAEQVPAGGTSPLADAFTKAGEGLASEALLTALDQAAADVKAAKWTEAATQQETAAKQILAVHDALRKAQIDAAREALSALEEKAKSDVEAQKEIEKLKAGPDKIMGMLPEKMPVKDLIEMRDKLDIEKRGGNVSPEAKVTEYLLTEKMIAKLNTPDTGKRQEFDVLKLGSSAGTKTPQFPTSSDRESNLVNAPIQEELKDLVGALLEEADEMQKDFETATVNTAFNINEAGEVGKLGGDMNSFAAAATTGNKKPPTRNVGGASRSGRRGARAHGIVVGDESVNRRGRDQVQEGQERMADQEGLIKETKSDDPQNDTSTGIGGKKVQSDDTKFSVADAGKWTDDMASRMGKPQDKNYIVERQDGKMDPRVAEMLRDLTSDHEQIIERVKAIRKELKNLYLPTDHLDEILAELQGQLDRLKERPTAEVFRLQAQTLDKLRGTMRVFHQASSNFQPSLPREQIVKGRIVDDADRPPPPGYAEAIKRYYEKLSLGEAKRQ